MRLAPLIPLALLIGCQSGDPVDFNADIRPILNEKCVTCHGGVRRRAELSLQFREDALVGGQSGSPAIVPGDPSASPLIQLVTHPDESERMPKDGAPLTEEEVTRLRRWIDQGAPWETHWAYVTPELPTVPDAGDWADSAIDQFVLARMNKEGLDPSPEAECHVLGRRVSLDLIGLPPNPDRLDRLCAAPLTDAAFSGYVDELLDHPGFGERWASMWLDLARYADSKGYEADRHRTIWRYRDWVINAFNRDLPFDEFTIEQLAGDLLDSPTTDQLIATAFHRNAMTNEEGGTDDEEHRVAAVMDRVNTTWEVWQGTTMSCTQCHGHPYDPFRQADYYRSMAVFNNTQDWDQPDEEPLLYEFADSGAGAKAEAEVHTAEDALLIFLKTPESLATQADWESRLGDQAVAGRLSTTVQNEVLRIAKVPAADRSPYQRAFIRDRFAEVHESTEVQRSSLREVRTKRRSLNPTTTPIQRELKPEEARVTRVMDRGNFLTQLEEVQAATPVSLPGSLPDGRADRLALAEWLVSAQNPLTARVTVNRFWEQLFGTGIVLTLEDFGTVGEPPSHPQLLDWLAVTFQQDMNWSMKTLLRTIVMSRTYRQSSSRAGDRDPNNRLLSRGPRVRLSGEQLRDQALAVSGLLSDKQFGPSVMPPQPAGVWNNPYNGTQWTVSEGEDRYRRAVYTYWRRTAPYPSMVTFDSPSREFCVSRRIQTNTPLQALVTLNDPVFWEASQALGRRMAAADSEPRGQLAAGYRFATGRTAEPETLDALDLLLAEAGPDRLDLAANVILNLDEVLTRE
ncbi:MAG: hypothetical protein ACI9W4_000613 [Rhodothermales bacterium]|jgi:hypothetical protein